MPRSRNKRKTFDATEPPLSDILDDIADGTIQLPDFQRGWIWDDSHIRSLLSSISLGHPIGAIMRLATGNDAVQFKPHPVQGADRQNITENPDWLILDGQQRLTSLLLAIYSDKPVETKDDRGNTVHRWYYIDMKQALNPHADREEAIISLPEDLKIRNFRGEVEADYSSSEKEYEAYLFPLSHVFDPSEWRVEFEEYWDHSSEMSRFYNDFEKYVIDQFDDYHIPTINLYSDTSKEAVCIIFEKVNTGGVPLNVFELLTAIYAADDFELRKDWAERQRELQKNEVLKSIRSSDFLQTVCLLATRHRKQQAIENGASPEDAPAISCKRKDILRMELSEYQNWADAALEGFRQAAKFLTSIKIYSSRDIPYTTQIVPLAAILTVLGDETHKESVKKKLYQWYWCGVFGELYGSSVETRFAKDLPEVIEWTQGGPQPTTVDDANFISSRLYSLRTRNSAAYKGIYALLLKNDCTDFRGGEPIELETYFDENIDIHHVFPRQWCKDNGIDQKRRDSIINKTPLTAKTNRLIGQLAPHKYLIKLQKHANVSEDRMDEILHSHAITPSTLRHSPESAETYFQTFYADREEALLQLIEKAMGKPVVREVIEYR